MTEPAEPAADGKPTLKKRVIRGTAITVIGHSVRNVLRLGSNLVLTRLLFPEAFGIMALVQVVLMGLAMVSDLGVHTSIIQHPRGDDRDFQNTGWTIQVGRGAILWGLGAALAIPFAYAYDEPQLVAFIPIAASTAMFQGLESTKLPLLYRHIQVGRLTAIDLAAQAVGITTMITTALIHPTVWALVIGGVVQAATLFILSNVAIPGPRNRFRWEPEAAHALLTFGAWIFVSTLISFLAIKLDTIMLGKLITLEQLGVYNIGAMLSGLPIQIAGPVVGAVLLPALSESFRNSPAAMAQHFKSGQSAIVPLGVFVSLGPALLAPAFFYYLYDERYHDAGWIVQLSMLSVWFFYLQAAWTQALLAVGDSRSLALVNVVKLIATTASAVGGFLIGGLPGFIIGLSVGAACGYLVTLTRLARHGLYPGLMDGTYTLIGLGLGLLGALTPPLIATRLAPDHEQLVGAVVAVLILVPFGAVVARSVLMQVRGRNRG